MPQASSQLTATGDPTYDKMTEQEKNLIRYHRKHLKDGTFMQDEQGNYTTLWETGFTGPDGKVHAVPGYVDGRKLDPQEVGSYYMQRPDLLKQYPTYNSPEEADAAAMSRGPIKESDLTKFLKQKKR